MNEAPSPIDLVITARPRDVGAFTVRRTLPVIARRSVGPFVFFDHMGPVALPPGSGADVGPHPHIGLATVTYLFDGELTHRDSLGSHQPIRSGDVNWMVAGRGIVHSERSDDETRRLGAKMHGIQSWVALPVDAEEGAPRFEHHPGRTLPEIRRGGATLRVIAGTAYGEASPVGVASPTLYVDARLDAGATLEIDDAHEERAVYVAVGTIACAGQEAPDGTMLVLRPGARAEISAEAPARVMLLGGSKLDGPRHIWWNFVSSSKERIEKAKRDWQDGRFGDVPGDDGPPIPLPDR
jgi:redox-sensitive bicupin YhaK (pirin superfamily)